VQLLAPDNTDSDMVLQRAGSVDFTPTLYLVVEWLENTAIPAGYIDPIVLDQGVKTSEQTLAGGWKKTYFRLPADQTTLTFRVNRRTRHPASILPYLRIRDLTRTDTPAVTGTGRQSFRSLTVGGNVTTQGTVDVAAVDGVTALGGVILFTYPAGAGYQPHLSPWLTLPVSRTADTTTFSGARHLANVASEWIVPVTALPPGEYQLVARISETGSAAVRTITYTSQSRISAAAVDDVLTDTWTGLVTASSDYWTMAQLGVLNLPGTPLGPLGDVKLTLSGPSTVNVDELWLFSTAGKLTMVDRITSPRFAVRAPSLLEPTGSIWTGAAADGSNWFGAGSLCKAVAAGGHDLEPGENDLFVGTSGVANPSVTSRHYDRVISHPVSA
jgi:hypothetical protein